MLKDYKEYLKHVNDECSYLVNMSKTVSYEDFIKNDTLKKAFTRSIEIIGEASKNIPNTVKDKYNSVNWRSVCGMRDILIHDYFDVDYAIVWRTVNQDIPLLLSVVKQMLEDK